MISNSIRENRTGYDFRINLRDFPDTLHREAKSKAALEGITLKDLIIKAVELYLKKGLKEKKSAG